jgi:biotin carboxyl carrier protein
MSSMHKLLAPVPGLVAAVSVAVGATVGEDDVVVVLQAMKMEIPVAAEVAGRVEAILVEEGEEVELGAPLARIAAS